MSILTKTFIVLTLVFSLALAVLLVLEVGRISPYNEQLTALNQRAAASDVALAAERTLNAAKQAELNDAIKTLQDTETRLSQQITSLNLANNRLTTANGDAESHNGQLVSANAQAQAVISSMKDQLAELMKENAAIRPQITDYISKNAELNRVNNELQTQNRFAEQAIRKLQEQIANSGNNNSNGASGAINSTGNQVTESGPGNGAPAAAAAANNETRTQINGRITKITQAAGHTLIETPLGSTSQVKVGTHFTIYRNNGTRPVWVGDAVVSNVTDDASVATITATGDGQAPQQGDLVMSGNAGPQK